MLSRSDSNDFLAALAAAEAPLRFAAQDGFAHLDRVKNLETTVVIALRQAYKRAPKTARRALREAAALLSNTFAPVPARIDALRRCGATLRALRATVEAQPSDAHPPETALPSVGVSPTQTTTLSRAEAAGQLTPSTSVQYLKGVGPRIAELLATRHLHTVADLLWFLPRRYQDQRGFAAIAALTPNVVATVEGEILATQFRQLGPRRSLEVMIGDDTGRLHLVWFRVPGGQAFAQNFKYGQRCARQWHA